MAILSLQSWLAGLDTRRSELTSSTEVLETLQDCHINQGAEIEKRKAFVPAVGAVLGNSAFSANVFGLETGSSLYAFGSAASTAVTVPANVTYIQCTHPTDTSKSMTAILCSCEFGGEPFCVAQFGTEVYWYLNGVVISASIAGQILTISSIASNRLTGATSGAISDGDTVTIGTQIYRFKTVMSQAYDVQLLSGIDTSLANLVLAINGAGVAGTNWYGTGSGGTSGLLTSTFVSASQANQGRNTFFYVYALIAGVAGNSIVTTTTSSHLSWAAGTLTGGNFGLPQSISQIAAQMYNIMSSPAWKDAGIFVENLAGGQFNIYTEYGVTWTPTVNVTSVGTGMITTMLLSNGIAPVSATTGSVNFTLYAGTQGSLATLNIIAGSTTYKLLTSPSAYTTNLSATIQALATHVTSEFTPSSLAISAVNSANILAISQASSASLIIPANNWLSYSLDSVASTDLCFENIALDCSGVATLQSLTGIYTSNGVSIVPGVKYETVNNVFVGNPSGTGVSGGVPGFVLSYGTYLWIPGNNDVSISALGVHYSASNYPQGAVISFSSDNLTFVGKAGASPTFKLFALTDILNYSSGLPLGGSNATVAGQLVNISAQIRSNNNGWTASSIAAVTPPTGNTTLFLSRRALAINATAYSGIYIYTAILGISPVGFFAPPAPTSFGVGQPTAAIAGRGTTYAITFTGTWAAGDQYTFDIVEPALTYTAGIGNITQLAAKACITLSNRVHTVAGNLWTASDNGDATQWEQQAPGAFQVNVSQYFQQADSLISLAAYQGRIALFANYVILIWELDANPINIALLQAMANIGTFSSLGPQSLGDLDVVFPSVTGFRSLRVRDLSLNAYVNDLGSPVDLLVQQDIVTVGLSNLASSCAIVEPSANRYWISLNGKIYVLSYFPSAKIAAAWGVYTPTFFLAGVQETFTPIKFVIFESQVYVLATYNGANYLFLYGGANNNTYDATPAIAATPWLDFGAAGFRKQVTSIDFAMTNAWQFFISMDYFGYVNNHATLDPVTQGPVNNPSFQLGSFDASRDGFHLKIQAICNAAAYSVLSALDVHYEKLEEKN